LIIKTNKNYKNKFDKNRKKCHDINDFIGHLDLVPLPKLLDRLILCSLSLGMFAPCSLPSADLDLDAFLDLNFLLL